MSEDNSYFEEANESDLSTFVLIKDSIFEESQIIDSSHSHHEMLDVLNSLVEAENEKRTEDNNRPLTLMERKHPDYKCYWPMLEQMETKENNKREIIRFGDGKISYRIEEV